MLISRSCSPEHLSNNCKMLPTPYVKCDYEKVYEPSEDSFLLLDALEKDRVELREKFMDQLSLVCEIGCGSGIVTTFMMQNDIPSHNALYLPTDINPWALETVVDTAKRNECSKKYLNPVQSDLTSALRPNVVDLLVFNPPYVPAEDVPEIPESKESIDQWLDLALLGGHDGMIVTQRLLDGLHKVLAPSGVAYILFCARNKPEKVVEMMKRNGWQASLVEHRKAGWEVLSVYKFYKGKSGVTNT